MTPASNEPATSLLARHIAGIAREFPEHVVAGILLELRGAASPSGLPVRGMTPRSGQIRKDLRELWQDVPGLTGTALAVALETASWAVSVESTAPRLEILWTGPAAPGVPVRRTDQALYELIEGAETDILLVSFAAYRIQRLRGAIERAVRRGVRVRVVLESASEAGGKARFDPVSALADAAAEVEVYRWPMDRRPTDSRGNKGSLHAKCAVVDGRSAMVSSANLTEHALELNMELGILVTGGGTPERIVELFNRLIDSGVLERQKAG